MSNGDEPDEESEATADESEDEATADEPEDEKSEATTPAKRLQDRLDDAAAALDDAETEADLDGVEATLDDIEADLEDATFPEADEEDGDEETDEEDGDEETADPREELETELEDLRDRLEDERGPYLEDVAEQVRDAASTVSDTRWTHDGSPEVVAAVASFLEVADAELFGTFEVEGDDPDAAATALEETAAAMDDIDVDPDEDADTIATLLDAVEALDDDLEAAEEWDDLSVREQLDHEGFYDVLSSESRKDYPPEWSALKIHEQEGNVEQVLLAYDRLDSEFFDDYVFDALKRMAPAEAFEDVHQEAQRRDHDAIEILGKIGDDRAVDTLTDFLDGDATLQKTSLRALGEIGSDEATQAVANCLADDDPDVRSSAARALGLIGDTRAIAPLKERLETDDADTVRASAAWALVQIGTERALDAASEHTDDGAYLVEAEARKAANATTAV